MYTQFEVILNKPADQTGLVSPRTRSFFFPSDRVSVVLCRPVNWLCQRRTSKAKRVKCTRPCRCGRRLEVSSFLHRYRRVCQCTLSERWYLYRSRQRLPVSVCTWIFRPPLSDRWDYSYTKIRLWLNMFTVIISWKLILSLLDSFSDAFSSALIFFVIPAVPTNIYILFFGGVKGK